MNNNQPTGNAVKKAKKSLFKSQIRATAILVAVVLVLAGVCAVVMYMLRADIDTYYETGSNGAGGSVTHTYYSRINPKGGYMLVHEDGTQIESFTYGESVCYETKLGTWLTITANGMIKVYAQVEGDILVDSENSGDTGSKSGVRTLLFASLERSEIKSIKVVNDEGGYHIVSEDVKGAREFYIEGYRNVSLDNVVFAGLVARCGRPLATKLSVEQMMLEDAAHAGDEGYIPIIKDGKINYSVYGLDETYEVVNKETGETETKTTPYYVITDNDGNSHKVIVGQMVPDGNGYYIRYMGGTNRSGEPVHPREAVYTVMRQYASSTGYVTAIDKTILAPAAEIVQPTIIYAMSATEHFDVRQFTVSLNIGKDGDGNNIYDDIVCLTYDDLEKRLNTFRQDLVYHFENSEALGLSGYEPDTDRVFEVLQALTDVSAAASASETPGSIIPSANYVNTVALISPKLDLENLDLDDPDVAEAAIKLNEYGLLSAKYIISFNMPVDGFDDPVHQALFISEKTENDTYYVWSPTFSQVVEIGSQYLFFLEWDSFDWVDRLLMHTFITFNDFIRVTAGDFDALFTLYQTHIITTKQYFADDSQSAYNVRFITDKNGELHTKLSMEIPYRVMYQDGTTGTEKLVTGDLVSLRLSTVENYCRLALGLPMLEGTDPSAVERYSSSVTNSSVDGNKVTVLHKITVAGDDYGYLKASEYQLTFIYEDGRLVMKIRPVGMKTERVLYDSHDFALYYKKYVDNGGENIDFTDAQNAAADEVFLSVTRVNTEEYRATVSINGGEPTDIPVDAYKDLYEKLILASFYGRVDEIKSGGATALTKDQIDGYIAKGDDCDLRIEVGVSVGDDFVYQIHDYTGLRSFVVLNGNGRFYINRMTKNDFINAAKTVANGDRVFDR